MDTNFQSLYNQYANALTNEERHKLDQLRNILGSAGTNYSQGIGSQKIGAPPKAGRAPFASLGELNAALGAKRKAEEAAKPKPVDRPKRIKEIEAELDIIRGVVPTPKGYTIDKTRIRSLLAELKELQA